jgi:trehalose 6-phosphate synthase/phosphatase
MIDRPVPLIVASNRLPVQLVQSHDGTWKPHSSDGGLVRALRSVLATRRGTWVGWGGACDLPKDDAQELIESSATALTMRPVALSEEDREGYYLGFSNRTLWPVLHELPERAEKRAGDWESYRKVNAAFADALAAEPAGAIWVHDYHLMLVAERLRRLGCRNPLAFFLHTPFPNPDALRSCDHGDSLVRGLAQYDLIGFQTPVDRSNFLEAAARLRDQRPEAARRWRLFSNLAGRCRAFPISVDPEMWSRLSEARSTVRRAAQIRRSSGVEILMLGVDRLDYTKGIPEKIRAFARVLAEDPALRGRILLRQLAIPSRSGIAAYDVHRCEVEALVADVNERFGGDGWTPVDYIHGRWDDRELAAQYRAADVALVTPLRDGMNLVAKEYVASQPGTDGVLVLGRSAGAATQLGPAALLADPRDEEALATAILRAVAMEPDERARRMTELRRRVRSEDVWCWAASVLAALDAVRRPGVPAARSVPPSVDSRKMQRASSLTLRT